VVLLPQSEGCCKSCSTSSLMAKLKDLWTCSYTRTRVWKMQEILWLNKLHRHLVRKLSCVTTWWLSVEGLVTLTQNGKNARSQSLHPWPTHRLDLTWQSSATALALAVENGRKWSWSVSRGLQIGAPIVNAGLTVVDRLRNACFGNFHMLCAEMRTFIYTPVLQDLTVYIFVSCHLKAPACTLCRCSSEGHQQTAHIVYTVPLRMAWCLCAICVSPFWSFFESHNSWLWPFMPSMLIDMGYWWILFAVKQPICFVVLSWALCYLPESVFGGIQAKLWCCVWGRVFGRYFASIVLSVCWSNWISILRESFEKIQLCICLANERGG